MRCARRLDNAGPVEGYRILLPTTRFRALSKWSFRHGNALSRSAPSDRHVMKWVKPSQPAQIVRHAAELPKQFGFAELAHHWVTGAAEGDRANAASRARKALRTPQRGCRRLAFFGGACDRRPVVIL